MSATATPTPRQLRPARRRGPRPAAARKRKKWLWAAVGGELPAVSSRRSCCSPAPATHPVATQPSPAGPAVSLIPVGPTAGGHFAAPLQLQPGPVVSGRRDRVRAARDRRLRVRPRPRPERSRDPPRQLRRALDAGQQTPRTPAPAFTFADADALGNLPYGTNLRVARPSGRQLVLDQARHRLRARPRRPRPRRSSTASTSGTASAGATRDLEEPGVDRTRARQRHRPDPRPDPQPRTTQATGGSAAGCGRRRHRRPLQLTPGQTAQINPTTGAASAPADAPRRSSWRSPPPTRSTTSPTRRSRSTTTTNTSAGHGPPMTARARPATCCGRPVCGGSTP